MTITLHNFGGELIQARRIVSAGSVDRVRGAILRARADGGRVRPLGTGFTISDVTVDDDAFLSTDGSLAPTLLTPPSGRRLVRVHAGTTVAAVTAFLRPRGLMLEVTPNFTGVSFIGAAATCSHGASVHHAPLGACIRAFEIVDGEGRHRWITETGDRELVPSGASAEREPALFSALLVHLGAIAFVSSVVIEPVPAFYISETRERLDWRGVRRILASDELVALDTLAAFVCPYELDGRRDAALIRQSRHARRPGLYAAGGDSPGQMALMYLQMLRAMVTFRVSPQSIPERLARALDVFMPARQSEGDGHVFMGTDYLGMPPRGIALELAIPFDHELSSSRERMVERIDEILTEIERMRSRGRFVGGYLSIRFARRWTAPLSLSHGKDACFVEILVVDGTPRQRDVLRDLEETLRPHGLRRHTGLLHHHAPGELPALYPRLEDWIAARDRADPDGVFRSPYVIKHGLTRSRIQGRAA